MEIKFSQHFLILAYAIPSTKLKGETRSRFLWDWRTTEYFFIYKLDNQGYSGLNLLIMVSNLPHYSRTVPSMKTWPMIPVAPSDAKTITLRELRD